MARCHHPGALLPCACTRFDSGIVGNCACGHPWFEHEQPADSALAATVRQLQQVTESLCAASLDASERRNETSPASRFRHDKFVAGNTRNFSPVGGPPVLSAQQLSLLHPAGGLKEFELTRLLVPMLEPLFPGRVMCSSELNQWLPIEPGVENRDLAHKPDLTLTWKAFLTPVAPGKKKASAHASEPLARFIPCSPHVYSSVAILDATKTLTDDGRGELRDHLRTLARVRGVARPRGVVFDADQFEMWEFGGQFLRDRVIANWSDPGSAAALQEFLHERHFSELKVFCDAALDAFGADFTPLASVVGFTPNQTGCHLGSGGTAVVFSVKRQADDKVFAMKVAVGPRPALALQAETLVSVDVCTKLGADLASELVTVPVQFHHQQTDFGITAFATLFEPVLPPVTRKAINTLQGITAAFAALHRLHERGVAHGDPRYQNLLVNDPTKYRFCDFVRCDPTSKAAQHYVSDVTALTASIIGKETSALLPFSNLLRVYKPAPSAIEELTKAVWLLVKQRRKPSAAQPITDGVAAAGAAAVDGPVDSESEGDGSDRDASDDD